MSHVEHSISCASGCDCLARFPDLEYAEAVEQELALLSEEEQAEIDLAADTRVDLWIFGEVTRNLTFRGAMRRVRRAARYANGHITIQRASDGVLVRRF
jgi:hypothetical protein